MIFTTHVVDWHQSVLDNSHSVSNQVWKHTVEMLEILGTNDISGTFFVQDSVAVKYPVLIRKIKSAGHEVGCFFDTPYTKESFHQKAKHTVDLLEDITGTKVIGSRSQSLSIQRVSFDNYCYVLRNLGIQYDSSLFSNRSIKKHIEDNPSLGAFKAYGVSQYTLPSFSALPFFDKPELTFGGSTFRLLPYELNYLLANQLNKESAVFHMPIYDLGAKEYALITASHELPWYRKGDFIGRSSIANKLKKLFGDYPFDNFQNHYFDGYK